MSDLAVTAILCGIVSAACCGIVWSMVAFERHVNQRWEWLQRSLAERDRELQR
jgi:hypothetical protein